MFDVDGEEYPRYSVTLDIDGEETIMGVYDEYDKTKLLYDSLIRTYGDDTNREIKITICDYTIGTIIESYDSNIDMC